MPVSTTTRFNFQESIGSGSFLTQGNTVISPNSPDTTNSVKSVSNLFNKHVSGFC